MLICMALAAIFASALLMSQPESRAQWRCSYYYPEWNEARYSGPKAFLATVTRSLDTDGNIISDRLWWTPGLSRVSWVRSGSAGSPTTPFSLRADYVMVLLTLDRPARRPVWLVLRADGREVTRRLLFRQISDLPDWQVHDLTIVASFSADLPQSGPMPDLSNAAEILISAEEEGGERLAGISLRLPSQALLREVATRAIPSLDHYAADYRTRCRVARPTQAPPAPPTPAP
jgi:hypothetical protein